MVAIGATLALAATLSACGGSGGSPRPQSQATDGFTVGGTLTGWRAGGAGSGVVVTLNGANDTTLSANGSYSFSSPIAAGQSYTVAIKTQPTAAQYLSCAVTNASGTVGAAVTNANITCSDVGANSSATGLLNDTGIDWCSENITTSSTWVNNAVCSVVNWVGNLWGQQQDAFSGRDAQAKAGTLQKIGAGAAGFDFTKIASTGQALVIQNAAWSDTGSEAAGTMWDCVRDNVTGLVWEVKRNDATHLRHMGHGYAWYNPDATSNGGSAGYATPQFDTNGNTVTGPTCTGVADTSKCNTQSYVAAVNNAGLCGKTDWRLPTVDELRNLAHTGHTNPAIDTDFFPNTSANGAWSSSPNASSGGGAWYVNFNSGYGYNDAKNDAYRVRLVRSGQ